MAYPPKTDPQNKTWVIAFDINMKSLKKYCEEKASNKEECKEDIKRYRTQIFNTIYEIVGKYGFSWRMQNSLVYNSSPDATKAFKAISLGLKKSWVKHFIEKLHLFEIDPNSDARELLELDKTVADTPDWFTPEMLDFMTNYMEDEEEE